MRTLRIDFNAENMLPDGDLIGRMGEHNAADLVITPTEEMASCDEITSYIAAFVTEGRIIRTDFQPKAEQITVPVCAQLTQGHTLSVQLEGYDGEGSLVVKSPVASLRLLPSAGGDETDYDSENGGLVSQINLNILARHKHENTSVLDNLGESGGRLTFGGKPVKIDTPDVKTLEFFNNDNNISFFSEYGNLFISGPNNYISTQIFAYFQEPVPELPVGTKIEKIDIKLTEGGEFVSLDFLCSENTFYPIIKMTDEVVSYADCRCFFIGFCMFGHQYTKLYDIVENFDWYSMRITFRNNTEAE